jgi:hypothetical protein
MWRYSDGDSFVQRLNCLLKWAASRKPSRSATCSMLSSRFKSSSWASRSLTVERYWRGGNAIHAFEQPGAIRRAVAQLPGDASDALLHQFFSD